MTVAPDSLLTTRSVGGTSTSSNASSTGGGGGGRAVVAAAVVSGEGDGGAVLDPNHQYSQQQSATNGSNSDDIDASSVEIKSITIDCGNSTTFKSVASVKSDLTGDVYNNNSSRRLLRPSSYRFDGGGLGGGVATSVTSEEMKLPLEFDDDYDDEHDCDTPPTTMRVRITNDISGRSKDLVLDTSDTSSLYDAIYDAKSVKEAHVRKWGPKYVQQVKSKKSEIQIAVWDDDTNKPWKVYTVNELKSTTIQQLRRVLPESNFTLAKLVLQCVPITVGASNVNTASTITSKFSPKSNASTLSSSNSRISPTTAASAYAAANAAAAAAAASSASKNASKNPLLRNSTILPATPTFVKADLTGAITRYSLSSATDAIVRSPPLANAQGIRRSNSRQLQDEQQEASEVTYDDGVATSNSALPVMPATQEPKNQPSVGNVSAIASKNALSSLPILPTSVRIRITNEVSSRYKDLILDVNDELNLYDTVYDAKSVKEAHVRKWGSDYVRQVKDKVSEIRISVVKLDDQQTHQSFDGGEKIDDRNEMVDLPGLSRRIQQSSMASLPSSSPSGIQFTVCELKEISTKKLYQMVVTEIAARKGADTIVGEATHRVGDTSGMFATVDIPDPIQLLLRCVRINDPQSSPKNAEVSPMTKSTSTNTPQKLPKWHTPVHSSSGGGFPGNRCPFSGVQVDPAAFEAFKQKLKDSVSDDEDSEDKNEEDGEFAKPKIPELLASPAASFNPPSVVAAHYDNKSTRSLDVETLVSGLDSSVFGSVASHIADSHDRKLDDAHQLSPILQKTTMRIRITNESSQRSKDLVVDIDETLNLYDTVYNARSVKDAHVRKWGPEFVKQVKAKTSEIHCSIWDGELGQPSHRFTVDELKETSTKQLFEMVEDPDCNNPISLVLQCVSKESLNTSYVAAAAASTSKPIEGKKFSSLEAGNRGLKPCERSSSHSTQIESGSRASSSCGVPSGGSTQSKTPSGCEIKVVATQSSPTTEVPSLNLATLRASGQYNLTSPTLSSHHDEDDTSPPQLPQIGQMLHNYKSDISRGSGRLASSSTADRDQSTRSGDEFSACEDSLGGNLSSDGGDIRKSLRIRVVNATSKRRKDLLVSTQGDNNLYDAVYNNKSVKDAHIRKWGPKIVQDVKNNLAEIQVAVWDDDTDKPWHVYSVDDLKTTSIQQLREVIPESQDIAKLVLQWVKKDEEVPRVRQPVIFDDSNIMPSLTFEKNGRPQSTLNMAKCMSESNLKRQNSRAAFRKPSRPNHMSFSAMKNASFGAGNDRGGGDLGLRSASTLAELRAELSLSEHHMVKKKKEISMRPNTMLSSSSLHSLSIHSNGSFLSNDTTSSNQVALSEKVQRFLNRQHSFRRRGHALANRSRRANSDSSIDEVSISSDNVVHSDQVGSMQGSFQSKSKSSMSHRMTLSGHSQQRSNSDSFASFEEYSYSTNKSPNHASFLWNLDETKVESQAATISPTQPTGTAPEVDVTDKVQRFLNRSKAVAYRRLGASLSGTNLSAGGSAHSLRRKSDSATRLDETSQTTRSHSQGSFKEEQAILREFQRLCRAKKGAEYQSRENLRGTRDSAISAGTSGSNNARFPSTGDKIEAKKPNPFLTGLQMTSLALPEENAVNMNDSLPNVVQMDDFGKSSTILPRLSSITLNAEQKSFGPRVQSTGAPNASFSPSGTVKGVKPNRFLQFAHGSQPKVAQRLPTSPTDPKTTNKINRFLKLSRLPASDGGLKPSIPAGSAKSASISTSESATSPSVSKKTATKSLSVSGQSETESWRPSSSDVPPIMEIEVVQQDGLAPPPASPFPGISLSPEVVKDVFPYHIVVDADFRILQVGNSLSMLIDESIILGRAVSDILMVTGPIPMFGKWDWSILDKMKDKTIFLESVLTNSSERKAKIKGTIIQVSTSPKQAMLALLPNVKNLSELSDMSLSMSDLPLHSCQREAVLLGEHSKSEVKLSNHLDKVHRDLLDSMERQIEDRTDELATANQDLARANEQLAIQSARQLEHFACMSHEIRTPLNCIVGMSSLLLEDDAEMDPMHADSISMINTSGELLKAVVDDVLDYAKLESGSFEVDIKPISLQDCLDSVAHSIAQKIQDKNIRLRTFYSPTLPESLETDSRRLQQVLFNLLGNSGKFSKNNSVIDLTVTLLPAAERKSAGMAMGKEQNNLTGAVIRFSVKDYGKGIDKKDFKTIFEPFSQASKETQNIYGGTGLGLSITSKLVHRLGGNISLDSQLGRFTEFTVDLPFNGAPVNVENLKKNLIGTTIVLVEPKRMYDYSFTQYPIKEDHAALDTEVCNTYKLNIMRFKSMEDIFPELDRLSSRAPKQHYAIVVKETLFKTRVFESLESISGKLDFTLMTYGPNYAVELTRNFHFKSLRGIFPAVLLESISKYVLRQTAEPLRLEDNVPPPAPPQPGSLFAPLNAETAPATSGGLLAPLDGERPQTGGLFAPLHNNGAAPATSVDKNGGLFAALGNSKDGGNRPAPAGEKPSGGGLFAALDNESPSPPLSEATQHGGGLFAALNKTGVSDEEIVATSRTSQPRGGGGLFAALSEQNVGASNLPVPASKTGGLFDSLNKPEGINKSRTTAPASGGLFAALDKGNTTTSVTEAISTPSPSSGGLFAALQKNPTPPAQSDGLFAALQRPPQGQVQSASTPATTPTAPSHSGGGLFAPLQQASGTQNRHSHATPIPSVSQHQPQPLQRQVSKTIAKERDLKVLIAEDNVVNQKVLSRVLNRSGIKDITIVDNGKKAVDISAVETFDCIFMDMQMPVMGGMEACRLIVERDGSQKAKVVFVTAHALDEFKAQAIAAGAISFISKPFRVVDITNLLETLGM